MYCSSCGLELASQAVICPKCGCATANFKKAVSSGEVSGGVIAASYIVGALIPIIGFIMAIYLLANGKAGHAMGVGALSICSMLFTLAVLSSL